MSYVDAHHDRDTDTVHVVERVDGKRIYVNYPAKYVFYYEDIKGKHQTIFGTPCTKFSTKSRKEFNKERRIHSQRRLFESEIKPVNRCLEDNYLGKDSPNLNVAFFDIEVDFDPERGFSSTEEAFAPITAISVYLSWLGQLVTLAMPPSTITFDAAEQLVSGFSNTILFASEREMLDTFLDLIEDADILTGWNSEGYDIPYTVNRIQQVLSKNDTRRMCLWQQYPKPREYSKFKKDVQNTYDLIGRVHLDYLELYRKFTYEERQSYSLDSIGEFEVGERKTAYEGTLDQLYKQDFGKFIEYNRQDVMLLVKIDLKLKLILLVNEIAHQNTVLLRTTLGAVATTEQAIINEAHSRGMVVPDRKRDAPVIEDEDSENSDAAAGAYVAYPQRGKHKWIGAVDINSLYPSVIRSLNMGPETIMGQIRQVYTDALIGRRLKEGMKPSDAWEGMFSSEEFRLLQERDPGVELIVDWETGTTETYSAASLYKLLYESNKPWAVSANGTIFTYEVFGVIPGLLERWYTERKQMQRQAKEATDPKEQEHWDRRQNVRKIQLNSLYGAILNQGCKFFDKRIGQSTTLTGRQIVKHMMATINEIFTAEYSHTGKTIIYGDTDSCFFSAHEALRDRIERGEIEWNKDTVVQLYDQVAEAVNQSFPDFMYNTFHTPHVRSVIRAGRELVASSGLFTTKKRYAVLIYDKEGKRKDQNGNPGEVKVKGLDLRRADTPVFAQQFLQQVLMMVLTDKNNDEVLDYIESFRQQFREKSPWQLGVPKRVNNITKFRNQEKAKGKTDMPGHVRASLNWNKLREMHGDRYSSLIVDGQKTIVCKLKSNLLGMTSIAYPIDQLNLPAWFKELPFDTEAMEEGIIDAKLKNLLGVLNWEYGSRDKAELSNLFFS